MSVYYTFSRTHVASVDGASVKFKSKAKPINKAGVCILFNDAFRALMAANINPSDVSKIECDGARETQFIAYSCM